MWEKQKWPDMEIEARSYKWWNFRWQMRSNRSYSSTQYSIKTGQIISVEKNQTLFFLLPPFDISDFVLDEQDWVFLVEDMCVCVCVVSLKLCR